MTHTRRSKIPASFFPLFVPSALISVAVFLASTIAIGETFPRQSDNSQPRVTISDGSVVRFDNDRASITPIKGWEVALKGLGMSLVMKEVAASPSTADMKPGESKTFFARNISVMTLKEPSPIDDARAKSFQEEFSKQVSSSGVMANFKFTGQKLFNFKGVNDGLVFFAEHTAGNHPMQQMMVLVSNHEKQYLLTYTDMASQFANPEAYNQAWKTLTSIDVSGTAPVRYRKELELGLGVLVAFLLICIPAYAIRWFKERRISGVAADLQNEWDRGEPAGSSVDSSIDLSMVTGSRFDRLSTTRVARATAFSSLN
jgi:hypothetical protein